MEEIVRKVEQENSELIFKTNNLKKFLNNIPNDGSKISKHQYDLLIIQHDIMVSYQRILDMRLVEMNN